MRECVCVCVCVSSRLKWRMRSFRIYRCAAGLPAKPTRQGAATVAASTIAGPRHISRPSYVCVCVSSRPKWRYAPSVSTDGGPQVHVRLGFGGPRVGRDKLMKKINYDP